METKKKSGSPTNSNDSNQVKEFSGLNLTRRELLKNGLSSAMIGIIYVSASSLGIATIGGISGCGGGGSGGGGSGGGGSDNDTSTLQGFFVDSPVEGLDYRTATRSGITNAAGTFEYQNGEVVTFSIGDVVLGEGTAKQTMTPIDLVAGAVDQTNPVVTNICRFLLSLTVDGDYTTRVLLSTEIRNEVDGRPIYFQQSIDGFESDPDVENLFITLNALNVFTDGNDRELCPYQDAQNHLLETLREDPGYSDYSDYSEYIDYSDYSDYSEYSDYSDYSEYSEYSDYYNYYNYTTYYNYFVNSW
jgi:hypothetical protein